MTDARMEELEAEIKKLQLERDLEKIRADINKIREIDYLPEMEKLVFASTTGYWFTTNDGEYPKRIYQRYQCPPFFNDDNYNVHLYIDHNGHSRAYITNKRTSESALYEYRSADEKHDTYYGDIKLLDERDIIKMLSNIFSRLDAIEKIVAKNV
jgi:hypothetical protein